jgi:hypothetical protein
MAAGGDMDRRRSAMITLWAATLVACASEGSTATDGGALEGASVDAALAHSRPIAGSQAMDGQGRLGETGAPAAGEAPTARSAPVRPAVLVELDAVSSPAAGALRELHAVSSPAAGAASAVQAEQIEHELESHEPAPYPGVALASSIAGVRALVGDFHGEPREHVRVRVLEEANYVLALANAPGDALDRSTRAWRRRAVRVLTSAEQSCTGRVASLELATPWIWKDEAFDPQARPSEHELRKTVSPWLGSVVARVVLDDPGSCRGKPLLVQDAAQPSPRVARALPRVPQAAKLLAAFHALPEYRALQAECMKLDECSKEPATGLPVVRSVELRAFRFADDTSVYVTASMAEGGCGEWAPPLSAIFVLDAVRGAEPAVRRVNARAELGSPLLLVDLGRDGRLELVTDRFAAGRELVDEDGSSRQSWSTHFVGCGC